MNKGMEGFAIEGTTPKANGVTFDENGGETAAKDYDGEVGDAPPGPQPDWIAIQSYRDHEHQMPVTAQRTGKWHTAAIHNVTALVGAGVLGLPYAVSFLSWSGGAIVLTISYLTSLYTLWQLSVMHETDGLRFNRYHEIGQYAMGPRLGLWIVIPFQIIVMCGLGIVYMITGGVSMWRVWKSYGSGDTSFGPSAWIVVFFGAQLFLSQIPYFNQLKAISFAAALMSLGYSTIATGVSIAGGRAPGTSYSVLADGATTDLTNQAVAFEPSAIADGYTTRTTADAVFGAFQALGTLAFAFGGHNIVLEIQATLPSPPRTLKRYMSGVYVAYAVVAWCYYGTSFSGYWAFGNQVRDNIFDSVKEPRGIIALGDMMIVVHVLGSYQLYSMPIYDMIETLMIKRRISTGLKSRLIYRSVYCAFTAFVAISLPFFSEILGFIGAVAFGPTTFALPSIFWLLLRAPKRFSRHWFASWICISYGILTTVCGSIGGMRNIIQRASGFKFYP